MKNKFVMVILSPLIFALLTIIVIAAVLISPCFLIGYIFFLYKKKERVENSSILTELLNKRKSFINGRR